MISLIEKVRREGTHGGVAKSFIQSGGTTRTCRMTTKKSYGPTRTMASSSGNDRLIEIGAINPCPIETTKCERFRKRRRYRLPS